METKMDKFLKFFKNFFNALDNKKTGHSLKKWLAVGTFWLMCVITIRYVDSNNLTTVLGILSGLVLTLMGVNTIDKYVNKPEQSTEQPKI